MGAPEGRIAGQTVQILMKDRRLTGEWVLDPAASSVRLKTKAMRMLPVAGVFREVSGWGSISPDGRVSGTLVVGAGSIDTRNPRRDKHLRSADFFDIENTPDITFAADEIRLSGTGTGTGAVVTGTLTVRGRTRPLSVDITASAHGDEEIWLDSETPVNRNDFDVTWNWLGMVPAINTIVIHAVFIRHG